MSSEEGPPQRTRRWFADSSVSYALAAIALLEFARHHRGKFAFGPLDAAAMRESGLAVSGPADVLDRVAEVLARVEGLAEEDGERTLARLALRDGLDGTR